MVFSGLHRSISRWQAWTHEFAKSVDRGITATLKVGNRALCRGFTKWRDPSLFELTTILKLQHVSSKLTASACHRALATWRHWLLSLLQSTDRVRSALAHLLKRALAQAWSTWVEHHSQVRTQELQLNCAVSHLADQHLARAWHALMGTAKHYLRALKLC